MVFAYWDDSHINQTPHQSINLLCLHKSNKISFKKSHAIAAEYILKFWIKIYKFCMSFHSKQLSIPFSQDDMSSFVDNFFLMLNKYQVKLNWIGICGKQIWNWKSVFLFLSRSATFPNNMSQKHFNVIVKCVHATLCGCE